MSMTNSCYKRNCDIEIGGCGKEMERSVSVTVSKGKLHLCLSCAGKIIAELEGLIRGC